MRLFITYSSYPSSDDDWQVRFMYDMVHSLDRTEHIQVTAWGPPGPLPATTKYATSQTDAKWLSGMLAKGGIAHLLRNAPIIGLSSAVKLLRLLKKAYLNNGDTDVYHINWLQNALSLPDNNVPALITVLGTDLKLLKLPGMTPALKRIFKKHKCILAPNADWMVPILANHFQDTVLNIQAVPFGIEQRWFDITREVDYDAPRRWVSVIRVTDKKVGALFDWGEKIFTGADELHLYGPNQENITIPRWVHYHGPAAPEHLIQDVYPGAYGYISLSQHDEGRPQAILEAMASGLPIIASDIDAHCNLLGDTGGGQLINSAVNFARAVNILADKDVHLRACTDAREFIMRVHGTWDDCGDRYAKLYTTLMEKDN